MKFDSFSDVMFCVSLVLLFICFLWLVVSVVLSVKRKKFLFLVPLILFVIIGAFFKYYALTYVEDIFKSVTNYFK